MPTSDQFTSALACLDAFLAAFPAARQDGWVTTFKLFCQAGRETALADEAVDQESAAHLARLDEGEQS